MRAWPTPAGGGLKTVWEAGHVPVSLTRRPMAALLGRLVAVQRAGQAAAGVPLGYLARLQRAFGAGPPAPGSGRDTVAVPGIVDPLTSRELGVLGMLAAGRSNQAIAGELVVMSAYSLTCRRGYGQTCRAAERPDEYPAGSWAVSAKSFHASDIQDREAWLSLWPADRDSPGPAPTRGSIRSHLLWLMSITWA